MSVPYFHLCILSNTWFSPEDATCSAVIPWCRSGICVSSYFMTAWCLHLCQQMLPLDHSSPSLSQESPAPLTLLLSSNTTTPLCCHIQTTWTHALIHNPIPSNLCHYFLPPFHILIQLNLYLAFTVLNPTGITAYLGITWWRSVFPWDHHLAIGTSVSLTAVSSTSIYSSACLWH